MDTTVQDDPNQGALEEEDTTSQETIPSNDRPRRACVNQGIERLEMDPNNKEYASVAHRQLLMTKAMHVMLTQMSAYKGFKKHGEVAVAAIFKEL